MVKRRTCRAWRRSSMERCPARTRQLYGFSLPFSIGPRKVRPPPMPFRKVSRLSQSKLVRQKIKHWSILHARHIGLGVSSNLTYPALILPDELTSTCRSQSLLDCLCKKVQIQYLLHTCCVYLSKQPMHGTV